LPFIVAATTIGLRLDAIRAANAAALVAAGLLSVIVFPAIALQLLKQAPAPPAAADVVDVSDSSGQAGSRRRVAHAGN